MRKDGEWILPLGLSQQRGICDQAEVVVVAEGSTGGSECSCLLRLGSVREHTHHCTPIEDIISRWLNTQIARPAICLLYWVVNKSQGALQRYREVTTQ